MKTRLLRIACGLLLTLALTLAFSNMMDEKEIENQSQG